MKNDVFSRLSRTFARQKANTNLSIKKSILLGVKHDLEFLIKQEGIEGLEYEIPRLMQLINEELEKVELEIGDETT